MKLCILVALAALIGPASAQTLLLAGGPAPVGNPGTPVFVQGVGSDVNDNNGIAGNGYVFSLPNQTLAGNAQVLSIAYPYSATRTVAIVDSCGDTWPAPAVTTGTAAVGNMRISTYVLANASACAHQLTVTLDASIRPFQYTWAEFYNVAGSGAVDGSSGANNVACSAASAGSFTPTTNNNINGGHLIWAYAISNDPVGTGAGTQASAITRTGGVASRFMHANNISTIPSVSSFDVQPNNGAINAGFALTQSSGTNCVVHAVALKASNAGAAPPPGIRIVRLLHYTPVNPVNGANNILFPSQGNLLVVTLAAGNNLNLISSVTDTASQTYTARATPGNSQVFDFQNATSADNLVVHINLTGAGQPQFSTRFFDIADALPAAFLNTVGFNGASPSTGNVTTAGIPNITPTAAPGLVIDVTGWGTGPTRPPVSGLAGAFYDIVSYTGQTDQDRMDNADGTGHLFYSTTAAQAWNWNYDNASRNSTLFATAVAYAGITTAPPPTANDVRANWQKAGLAAIGGIPTRSTQCGATLTPSGIVPPASGDDASNLNAAIAACPAGQVLQFSVGTFNYAQSQLPILVDKGITLRGAGSPVTTCNAATGTPCWSTVLQTYDGPQPKYTSPASCGVTIGSTTSCPNASGFFLVAPSGLFNFGWAGCDPNRGDPTAGNCGAALAVDVAQGATTVQVVQTSGFSVGMWVLIDEYPALVTTTNPVPGQATILASPEFALTSSLPAVMRLSNPDGGNNMSACTAGGNPGYSFCINRLNQEIHHVTAIGAGPCPGVNCTLTFDSPLTLAFRQSGSHDARVYWPTLQSFNTPNPFLEQAGIENMTLHRMNGGAVDFEFCAYCWVKNVECNFWIAGCFNFNYTVRSQVTNSYLHNCIDCQNNGSEYPLGVSVASSENLVDNNIIVFGGKGMVGRGASSNVIAYNYVDKTFYMSGIGIGSYWNDMSLNGSHFGGTHHFLFEGNSANNCDGDETHGNAIYHVFYRNHCTGYRSTFVDPSTSQTINDCAGIGFADPGNTPQAPGPLRAAGPMAFNYWYVFIGNVLGQAGMQSCAGGVFTYGGTSLAAQSNRVIWRSGWTGGEWGTIPDANMVSGTPFIFRHSNYDYVNTAIVDYASGVSHSLANSYYLSSAPSYFGPGAGCTYPWPWVDPTLGTPIKSNSCSGSGLPAKARYDAGTPFHQP